MNNNEVSFGLDNDPNDDYQFDDAFYQAMNAGLILRQESYNDRKERVPENARNSTRQNISPLISPMN